MTDVTPVSAAPQLAPDSSVVDDVEALLLGAYRPLEGFLGAEDLAAVRSKGELADGTPWPVPIELTVAGELAEQIRDAASVVILDEEAAPVATVMVTQIWRIDDRRHGVAGRVVPAGALERGGYRELRRPAPRGDAGRSTGPVLAVPVDRPLHCADLAALGAAATALGARLLLMPLTGAGHATDLDGQALVRCARAASDALASERPRTDEGPAETGTDAATRAPLEPVVLPVSVPRHPGVDEHRYLQLLGHVAAAYGATHVPAGYAIAPAGIEEVSLPRSDSGGIHADEIDATVRSAIEHGAPVPKGLTLPAVERELRRAHRAGGGRGFTVLLSGLSGSGKSTIAKQLHAALLERTDRTVSLLDGDVVRRMLSSGLSFSRPDRELNVRRIGYVASEITRHGGIALCAPIAPYAATRAEVRGMVERHGGFLLVHVSTPLEVCERRDRKGLYAKARAGLIPEFTGISDPYEEPSDAELVIDTTEVGLDEAVDRILDALRGRRWLTSA